MVPRLLAPWCQALVAGNSAPARAACTHALPQSASPGTATSAMSALMPTRMGSWVSPVLRASIATPHKVSNTCPAVLPGHMPWNTPCAPRQGRALMSTQASAADGDTTPAVSSSTAPPGDKPKRTRSKKPSKAASSVPDEAAPDSGSEGEGLRVGKGTLSASGARSEAKAKAAKAEPDAPSKRRTTKRQQQAALLAESDGGSSAAPSQPLDLHVGAPSPNGPWANVRHWVVFSDLHVHPRSLPTCLEVLREVHRQAVARQAGILFLGDFWDERGALPVPTLNAVLGELGTWTQPTLMLVGNHDQVDIGGETHALTPLQLAFSQRLHVFSVPAVWRGALWVPYRRDQAQVRGAIEAALAQATAAASASGDAPSASMPKSSPSPEPLRAVFVHADVQTAKFNHLSQARDGLPPDVFPRDLPVYSGHYHLPQQVPNTNIVYIGSPYQVSAAEAGEVKRFLVLDAEDGWRVVEEVTGLGLGPRHLSARSLPQLQALAAALQSGARGAGVEGAPAEAAVQPGDRVRCSVPPGEPSEQWEALAAVLQQQGVRVELMQRATASRPPRITAAEDKGPVQLLEEYAATEGLTPEVLGAARDALDAEAQRRGGAGGSAASRHVDVRFERMVLHGFGPFRDRTEYALANRGLRAVTGCNLDDTGAESNGAGKTALMAAPLWALSGDMLARTESGAAGGSGSGGRLAVDSMLNDASKEGCVRLEGSVNGRTFVVERRVRRGKTARLAFELGGEDMEKQELRMTQALLEETFNTPLLRHAVCYGQNDVTALLEAGDAQLKELLGRVVDMEVWEGAEEGVKVQRKEAATEGMLAQARLQAKEEQVGHAEQGLEAAEGQEREWGQQQEARVREAGTALDTAKAAAVGVVARLGDALRQVLEGQGRLGAWAKAVDAEVKALEVAAPGTEEVPPMPRVPLPMRILRQQQEVSAAAAKAEAAAAAPTPAAQAGEVGDAWQAEVRRRHDEQLSELRAHAAEKLRLAQAEGDAACALAAEALEAAASQLLTAQNAEARLRVQREESEARLSKVRLAAQGQLGHGHGPGDAGSGSEKVPEKVPAVVSVGEGEAEAGKAGGRVGLGVVSRPVCEQCLQEVDPIEFMERLQRLEGEHRQLEADWQGAGDRLRAAKAAQNAARRVAEGAVAGREAGLRRVREEVEAREGGLRAEQRREVEGREAEAAAAAAAALQEQRRLQAEARERVREAQQRLEEALQEHQQQQARAEAEWRLTGQRVEEAKARRQAALRAAADHGAALRLAGERLAGAERQLRALAQRWPLAIQAWDQGMFSSPSPSEPIPSREQQQQQLSSVQALTSTTLDACSTADSALHKASQLQSEFDTLSRQTNPHSGMVGTMRGELERLREQVESLREEAAGCRMRVAVLEQAQKALGRGGVPSFVLEGVLGELQLRTDYYLEQLSDTMVLELSATRPSAASAKAAASAASTAAPGKGKGKGTRTSKKAAAAAGVDLVGSVDGDGEAEGAGTGRGGGSVGFSARSSAGDKEEIHKVVKVKSGDQLITRSLAQLSGGERRRVAVALALGFAELLRCRGRLSSNLLILDEVLQQLDAEGCSRVAAVLKGLPHDTVLVVGQAHSFITQVCDVVDMVVKSGGSSRVDSGDAA